MQEVSIDLCIRLTNKRGVLIRTQLEEASQFKLIGEPFLFKEYLAGKNLAHLLRPLALTPFSRTVLEQTAAIPFGETISYSSLAQKVGNPKARRAVAMALHRNPLPLFIPCHRVIAKDGSLGGFAYGTKIKEKILLFESQHLAKNFS